MLNRIETPPVGWSTSACRGKNALCREYGCKVGYMYIAANPTVKSAVWHLRMLLVMMNTTSDKGAQA